MAARRKPTAAEAEATKPEADVVETVEDAPDAPEVPDVETPTPEDNDGDDTPDDDGTEDAPEAPAGDALLLDPDGTAHTIVAAGVQALLNLGWTRAD